MPVFYFEVVMESICEILHQEASQPRKPEQGGQGGQRSVPASADSLIHVITACWSHPRAVHGRARGAAAKPRRTVITEQCGVLVRCVHSAEDARRLGLHSKGVCTLKRGHGALAVQSRGSTTPRPSRLLAESEKRTSSVLPGRRGSEKGAPAASPTLLWGPLLAARPGAPGGPGGCAHTQ